MRSVVVDIFLVVSLKIQIFCLTVGSSSLIFLFMVFKQQGRIWGLNSCRGGVVERKACWGLDLASVECPRGDGSSPLHSLLHSEHL